MVFAVVLILLGYVVILPLSLGNNPTHRTPLRMVGCSGLACFYSVYVYVFLHLFLAAERCGKLTWSPVLFPLHTVSRMQ